MDKIEKLFLELKTPDDRVPSQKELADSVMSTSATCARQKAAFELAELKDPRSFEPLVEAMNDWSCEVQAAAAYALSELGDRRARDAILLALKGESGFHGSNSLRCSLLKLGCPEDANSLINGIRNEWIASSAVKGLEKLLRDYPEKVEKGMLQEILAIKKVTQTQGAYDYRESYMAESVDIDLTTLKALAKAELMRR